MLVVAAAVSEAATAPDARGQGGAHRAGLGSVFRQCSRRPTRGVSRCHRPSARPGGNLL